MRDSSSCMCVRGAEEVSEEVQKRTELQQHLRALDEAIRAAPGRDAL